jgi:hypothetical protein
MTCSRMGHPILEFRESRITVLDANAAKYKNVREIRQIRAIRVKKTLRFSERIYSWF